MLPKIFSLAKLIENNGEIKESDFDDLDIHEYQDFGAKAKDELVVSRRRSVVLTHWKIVENRLHAKAEKSKPKPPRKRKSDNSSSEATATASSTSKSKSSTKKQKKNSLLDDHMINTILPTQNK